MKTTLLILFFCIPVLHLYGQSNAEAKAAYLLAEESYGKGDYESTLIYLKAAKQSLGAANSKILYLEILTEVELSKTKSANPERMLSLINEFEVNSEEERFSEEKILEIYKIKMTVKKGMAEKAELLAKEAEKNLILQKAREEADKVRARVGGIIVFEENGHGLVVAESDLKMGNFTQAMRSCNDLVLNGFDDWYLPSVEELKLIYSAVHLKGLGNFKPDGHWSSKFGFMRTAFHFGSSNVMTWNGSYKFNVRAVRKF